MINYQPFNLCCALGPLAARCTVCKKDFCSICFFEFHVKGHFMSCCKTKLYWKFLNIKETVAEQLELHPYIEKNYEK